MSCFTRKKKQSASSDAPLDSKISRLYQDSMWVPAPKNHKKVDMKKITLEQMMNIPIEENDLVPCPIFFTMQTKRRVDGMIRVHDIKTKCLKLVYKMDEDAAEKQIRTLSQSKRWDKDFQFDLLMAFWLAVHMESIVLVKRLIEYDVYLRQLVTLAMKNKPEKPKNFKPPKPTNVAEFKNVIQLAVHDEVLLASSNGNGSKL